MKHTSTPRRFACIAIGALACLATPSFAQQFEDFDTYTANSQVVGQGGWEEWGAGAGALVSTAKSFTSKNSIDIKGASDLVHQYSGYTSGTWVYSAMQYVPSTMTGKTFFILMSSFGSPNKWAVQVAFDATTKKVEADAGGGKVLADIVFDKWVPIRAVIHLDQDWVQFYYNGTLIDSSTVPDHATLGGGWAWTKGPFGSSTYGGLKNIGAVDLFANKATSCYYDAISLVPQATWTDRFDSYAKNSQVVKQGGWEEWGAGAGALVSDVQSASPDHSIDIKGASDLVHQYKNYTSGKWEYSALQYIPKAMTGKTFFILMSSFGSTNKWAVQVAFDAATGNVEADAGGGKVLTKIVYDEWVPLQVIVDLDADWVQFYYNGLLLDSSAVTDHPTLGGGWAWTKGPFGSSTYGGLKNIGAVDLFANGATSCYYDNMMLRPVAKGVRSYGAPTGGVAGDPELFAMGDAMAPNASFALGVRGPASAKGFLALGVSGYPQGKPLLGINLLINLNPVVLVAIVNTKAGGTMLKAPLAASHKGLMVYGQGVYEEPKTLKLLATNGLEIKVQ